MMAAFYYGILYFKHTSGIGIVMSMSKDKSLGYWVFKKSLCNHGNWGVPGIIDAETGIFVNPHINLTTVLF